MVRTTETSPHRAPVRTIAASALVFALCLALVAITGCSSKGAAKSGTASGSAETTSFHMSGAPVEVFVSQETIAKKPAPWALSTPESAVRSYLTWISYAYRIGNSTVATPTMSNEEEVRVDSFNQYNLEKKQILEQELKSITFGRARSTSASRTVLPARENWTYSYLSVAKGNAPLRGPYAISYDSTYTLVMNGKGEWVVDSVQAKKLGEPKLLGKAK